MEPTSLPYTHFTYPYNWFWKERGGNATNALSGLRSSEKGGEVSYLPQTCRCTEISMDGDRGERGLMPPPDLSLYREECGGGLRPPTQIQLPKRESGRGIRPLPGTTRRQTLRTLRKISGRRNDSDISNVLLFQDLCECGGEAMLFSPSGQLLTQTYHPLHFK
eukprot:TRINITY_DN5755_c0_g1_i1.p1 TRINITY_DN5755_c0_g1~~TRINITY_DN5755_c0_g1_i1.p1  ORF type:complete len:189 (-),score=34.90 TRINITY_DN5755_c0_g1_i1:595-1083(-)